MSNSEAVKKYDELQLYIEQMKHKPGPLMPVMQKAQDIFGALTIDVQEYIAEQMDIPMSDIYAVATFYSQFALEPKGKYIVGLCMGTACYVKNAEAVLKKLEEVIGVPAGNTTQDALFTLEATRCLGCCGLAPVMMVNDQVFGRLTPDDIPEIIEQFRQ